MVYLTRKEHFNAAHRLWVDDWTEERNRAVFGRCANDNYHGHNFDVFVTVKGEPDPDTGFVMNAHTLGQLIRTHITDVLDHRNLNLDDTFMKGIQPSTENMVMAMWRALEPSLEGCRLHCIKLVETEKIFVEYYGS